MDGAEYPKAMYRDGGPDLIWGEAVQSRTVRSYDEETEALAEGWRFHPLSRSELHPLDHDGDGHKGGSLPVKRRGRPPKVREE